LLSDFPVLLSDYYVSTLVPLKGKGFKLAALGEVKGKDALGVRISHKGHRDVSIYFDKSSGLPAKIETVVKNVESSDKEIQQEEYESNYKEFDGVKHATKAELMRDGKRFVEIEFSEIRPTEKVDASLFARP